MKMNILNLKQLEILRMIKIILNNSKFSLIKIIDKTILILIFREKNKYINHFNKFI